LILDSDFSNWAFIGLGSNLGASRGLLVRAMGALELLGAGPLLRSSLWRSAPVDCPPGSPDFLNAVVGLRPRSGATAESVLDQLQETERGFGRQAHSARHAPRLLDLDLLVFGREVRATAVLTLPHPRAHLRGFVLEPWSELAPGLVLPALGKTVSQLLAELPPGQDVSPLGQ
jgi:2-amino-4-hydroxy-6-hydroxymethyldihydropteridine diphosphokinase